MYFPNCALTSNQFIDFISFLKKEYSNVINININPMDNMKNMYDISLGKLAFKKNISSTHLLYLDDNYIDTYKKFNPTRRNEINKKLDITLIFKIDNNIIATSIKNF
jgi:hypothetical protein